jgi:uroporphyrinogen-III decarboxylase
MVKVKKTIGNRMPIGGNFPISTLSVGTKEDVTAEVKKQLKESAAGGGYIMMTSATLEETPAANVKAMIDGCKQFGVYK